MTWPNHIAALSAGNLLHVDHSTSFWLPEPDFLTIPYSVPSPWLPWRTICNCPNQNHVNQVCAKSDAVGYRDQCCMMVTILTDSYWVLTTPSMTRMTSQTQVLLVNLIPNIVLLSHLPVIGQMILSSLVVPQPDLKSSTFTWCIWSLHIHRRIISSHNLVTVINKKLAHSKIGTGITILLDLTTRIIICLSILPAMLKPSPSFHLNPISTLW